MSRPNRPIILMTMLGALLLTTMTALPDEADWREQDNAYDLARQAVNRGEALPLHEVRSYLQQAAPGKVVATQYEFEFDRWVYEFKIVDPQGQLRKVHIDARSGELVKVSDY